MKYLWIATVFCSSVLTANAATEQELSEKVSRYTHLLSQKETLNKKKNELAESIIAELQDGVFENSDCKLACRERLVVHTTIDEARKFGATKTVEQVDKEKVKEMFLSGMPIQGVEKQKVLTFKPKK